MVRKRFACIDDVMSALINPITAVELEIFCVTITSVGGIGVGVEYEKADACMGENNGQEYLDKKRRRTFLRAR